MLGIVALLYVIEGFPMGMYANTWPVYFRIQGVSLTEIGWFSGLSLAWSLKVLWSPVVDAYAEMRAWIAASLLAMALALMALSSQDTTVVGAGLWMAMTVYCLASATQDIAIDGYTIGLVDRGDEGPANSMRVTAYRGGLLLSGSVLLFLPRWIGWDGTFLVAAAVSASMAASVFACPRVDVPARERESSLEALRRWAQRPGVVAVAAFIMLYRVGDRAMGAMISPFWVDRGFEPEEIGIYSTTLGAGAMVAGAALGGIVVSRAGIYRSLWWLGAAALVSNLAYAWAALPGGARSAVIGASIVESFCGGLATAAFLSFLMRICGKEHAAVEYALLTALYAAAGSAVAVPSGAITEVLGYAGYFVLSAAFALPAFVVLPGIRGWLDDA
jgi:PAT family beta-lactamase induction signal transducer AmpG